MSRAVRIAVAAAIALAACAVARAEPPSRAAVAEGRRHFERGNALYQQGRYDDAITELLAGYAVDPRPDFLYAVGQAERKRGDCKAAIRYYQQYVDTGQSPQRTVAVLVQIDRCKQELAAAPVTPPSRAGKPPAATREPAATPTPPPPAPPPAVATPEQAEEQPATTTQSPVESASPAAHDSAARDTQARPIYKRWWVWTLVGVAAAGAAVGLGVGLTQQRSFNSTLPDLVATSAAVRF